jgi:hypothetical protein
MAKQINQIDIYKQVATGRQGHVPSPMRSSKLMTVWCGTARPRQICGRSSRSKSDVHTPNASIHPANHPKVPPWSVPYCHNPLSERKF